jgi:hypothetical protein
VVLLIPYDFTDPKLAPTCGRMDRHPAHEWILQAHAGYAPTINDCPGAPVIEGGSLITHNCGARIHPSEERNCCTRCESTVCPECSPCRRIA